MHKGSVIFLKMQNFRPLFTPKNNEKCSKGGDSILLSRFIVYFYNCVSMGKVGWSLSEYGEVRWFCLSGRSRWVAMRIGPR